MSTARKELVWNIKKNLFKLSGSDAYRLARDIATDDQSTPDLTSTDEEGCVDYIFDYMNSETLISSEDGGMSQLLMLNDLVREIINDRNTVVIANGVTQEHETLTTTSDNIIDPTPWSHYATSDMSNTRHDTATPAATVQNIQDTNHSTDTTSQSVDHLQVMHEELGKRLQHYKDIANVAHHSLGEPMPHQLPRHIPATFDTEKMVSLKDLSHLQRREFKIHGGQIGDQSSDITYSSICKQIDEGVREGFTGTEVIRAVLRIVKPGAFKDMLTHKDDITISELKGFLRPHLGEKASTELFQELMCAKQSEQEPPQQFLYRMIGLKQKILFQSKQANADIHYDPKTIQEVFLHTIYQGLGSKHTDIRQQLRPLLSNNRVTDEDIVSQVMKILSDENEHQRRLGYGLRQKATHSHSVRVDDIEQTAHKKEHQTIQQLSAQVETLTNMVAALMDQQTTAMHITHPKSVPVQVLGQAHSPLTSIPRRMPPSTPGQPSLTRKGKIPICTNCLNQGLENCNHCFVCGDPGHRAVGCLKRAGQQGNVNRPLMRDNQRPFPNSSPTQ